jgi:TetR/AcrR family transcriptional regulator, regulator of autoinduction and epiphytic fitness
MAEKIKTKRKYDSSRRKNQALETQEQILRAAQEIFIERGYVGTAIDAIAQKAGVAAETIYSIFGNKRAILTRVVDVVVVGDSDPIPLLARSYIREVESETNQRRQIEMFAKRIQMIMSSVAPLFEVMRSASKTEPEIAVILKKYLNGRIQGMNYFFDCVRANGELRVDKQTGVETLWTLTSAEVYNLLIADRALSAEEYEHWLADALIRLLLP